MRSFAISLLFVGGALAAQTASFTPFGTGCSFQGQALAIGNQGLPQIGARFTITYSGPNFTFSSAQQIAQPYLVLGFSTLLTPIPAGLLPQQPAGCNGFITGDTVIPTQPDPVTGAFTDNVSLSVPNAPWLAGFLFHAQWLCLIQQCGFAGCGPAAVCTSDAAFVLVGT